MIYALACCYLGTLAAVIYVWEKTREKGIAQAARDTLEKAIDLANGLKIQGNANADAIVAQGKQISEIQARLSQVSMKLGLGLGLRMKKGQEDAGA